MCDLIQTQRANICKRIFVFVNDIKWQVNKRNKNKRAQLHRRKQKQTKNILNYSGMNMQCVRRREFLEKIQTSTARAAPLLRGSAAAQSGCIQGGSPLRIAWGVGVGVAGGGRLQQLGISCFNVDI